MLRGGVPLPLLHSRTKAAVHPPRPPRIPAGNPVPAQVGDVSPAQSRSRVSFRTVSLGAFSSCSSGILATGLWRVLATDRVAFGTPSVILPVLVSSC